MSSRPILVESNTSVEQRFLELGSHTPCHLQPTRAYPTMMMVSVAFLVLGIGARPAQFIMQALIGCQRVVHVIERTPEIDSFSNEGALLAH